MRQGYLPSQGAFALASLLLAAGIREGQANAACLHSLLPDPGKAQETPVLVKQ